MRKWGVLSCNAELGGVLGRGNCDGDDVASKRCERRYRGVQKCGRPIFSAATEAEARIVRSGEKVGLGEISRVHSSPS